MLRVVFQNLQVLGAILSTKMEGSIQRQLRILLLLLLVFFALGYLIMRGEET